MASRYKANGSCHAIWPESGFHQHSVPLRAFVAGSQSPFSRLCGGAALRAKMCSMPWTLADGSTRGIWSGTEPLRSQTFRLTGRTATQQRSQYIWEKQGALQFLHTVGGILPHSTCCFGRSGTDCDDVTGTSLPSWANRTHPEAIGPPPSVVRPMHKTGFSGSVMLLRNTSSEPRTAE